MKRKELTRTMISMGQKAKRQNFCFQFKIIVNVLLALSAPSDYLQLWVYGPL